MGSPFLFGGKDIIKRKNVPLKLYFLLLIPTLIISYWLSGLVSLSESSFQNLGDNIRFIFTHFYRNWWNEKTPAVLAAGVLVWVLAVSYLMYRNRNFQAGREYGNEDWADTEEVDRRRRDPERKKKRIKTKRTE